MNSQRVNLDPESRAIIYQGASVNQLAEIWRMKPPDVMRRLGDLPPVGIGRQGNPIYNVADAAERLVKIDIEPHMIDVYMRSVNHSRLPPVVSKHYWEGKRVRERYRTEANELWHTEDLVRVAGTTYQSLRMTLMLLPDSLRDETDLTDKQFRVVQRVVDDALEEARARLLDDLLPGDYQVRPGSDDEDGTL
jgi:hypothetical protein